jgi:hypothetical protein
MPQCQFPVFCYFCVSENLHRKYSRNWTKQKPKLLFFLDEGRRLNESRRGARGPPHQGWSAPLLAAPGGGEAPLVALWRRLSAYLKPPKVQTLNQSVFSWDEVLQLRRRHRRILGDRSLCSGTLPRRGSAPGSISIDAVASSAISIDFTAISTNVVVSYDEERVVLPRG